MKKRNKKEQEAGQACLNFKTLCCKSNWIRKGRANLRCKKCDADVTMEIVLLYQSIIDS